MIIYELECGRGHRFEGWFPSLREFEQQRAEGLLMCAICGMENVARIPSGGHVGHSPAKKLFHRRQPQLPRGPQQAAEMLNANVDPVTLVKMVNHLVKTNFKDVGSQFAKQATEMHHGSRPHEPIYGTATETEQQTLEEDGVPFTGLPKLPESTHN